jgi:hypothetical protein
VNAAWAETGKQKIKVWCALLLPPAHAWASVPAQVCIRRDSGREASSRQARSRCLGADIDSSGNSSRGVGRAAHSFSFMHGTLWTLYPSAPTNIPARVSGAIDLRTRTSVVEALGKLRRELQLELEGLVALRTGLGRNLEELNKDIDLKRHMLELVNATEVQLEAQGRGQQATEGEGPRASTQATKGGGQRDVEEGGPGTSTQVTGPATPTSGTTSATRWGPPWLGSLLSLASLLWPFTSAPPLEQPRPSSPRVEPQPPSVSALPMVVWEEHLLLLLKCEEAARLGRTCKSLTVVVREHFRDVGTIKVQALPAALTTFPRARSLILEDDRLDWSRSLEAENMALLQHLCEGGRGRHLEVVRSASEDASGVVHKALQRGALPSLKAMDLDLECAVQRASLTRGFLGSLQELYLVVDAIDAQLAALGLVRQLPALTKLEVSVFGDPGDPDRVQWPLFIPPSLRTLRINVAECGPSSVRSLLGALHDMLVASGARLERLEVHTPSDFEEMGDGLLHLAQALRCCSPTLRAFLLGTCDNGMLRIDEKADDYDGHMQRLRDHWADLLAGVSACRELQVLVLPNIEVEPLFPPGTAFGRLTHLQVWDYKRKHPPDAGVMGLWELMASGGLPALAKLIVMLDGRCVRLEEVMTRVAPALEAVARTLTHLHLAVFEWRNDEVPVGYELGAALGKLRRLKDLVLGLFRDGQVYHAVTQGWFVSAWGRPLPLLWRVRVLMQVHSNSYLLASLLLPSVRVAGLDGYLKDSRAALLMACAVRQAGYKHTLELDTNSKALEGIVSAIRTL